MTKKNLQKLLKPHCHLDKGNTTPNEVQELRQMFNELGIFGTDASRAESAFYYRVFKIGFRAYEIEGIRSLTDKFIAEQGLTGKVQCDVMFWSNLNAGEREAYIAFMAEYEMGIHMITQRMPTLRFDEWELQGLRQYTAKYND